MSSEPKSTTSSSFDAATRGIMPDERVTRLHLLRHAEVVQMEERVVRGQLDVALSEHGQAQTRALVRWFHRAVPELDVIWSSDLTRCLQLAEQLAVETGVELRVDPRLREQDMGEWQGQTWSAITARDGATVTAYWDDYLDTHPTGGESYRELHQRVEAWWAEQYDRDADTCIAVVTHAGVLRSLQCSLLGFDLRQALRFAPEVASHSSFLISEAGAVQTCFGERPWTFGGDA